MLERAPRCLNPVPVQRARSLRCTSLSRRSLHSAFWRHGAGDLDLPTWCFYRMRAIFEPELDSARDLSRKSCDVGFSRVPLRPTAMLDFLYPPSTYAMIRRLTTFDLSAWQRQIKKWTLDTATRRFCSAARYLDRASSEDKRTSFVGNSSQTEVDVPAQSRADALRILDAIIRADERGEYKDSWIEAWDLFGRLDQASKTPQLTRRLISFLVKSTRSLDLHRARRLFRTLPESERNVSVYSTIIQAMLKLKQYGSAVYLHDQALAITTESSPLDCTRVLLGHLVGTSQWQLVFHTYERSLSSFKDRSDALNNWRHLLFKMLAGLPQIPSRVVKLLSAVEQHPYLMQEDKGHRKEFLDLLITAIVERGYSFGTRQNLKVIEGLASMGISRRTLYDRIILSTLRSNVVSMVVRKDGALHLYRRYRSESFFSPTREVLHTLIDHAAKTNDSVAVNELMADWYHFHGAIPASLAGLLMKTQSRQGNIEAVHNILTTHGQNHGKQTLRLLYPILHAYAVRADPVSVEKEIVRFQEELKLELDVTCWNILLNAYEKAKDLDGALSALGRLLDSKIQPDRWTFGVVMAVCADRGDVELCENVLDMASDYNVPRSPVMNECLIQAYLNDERTTKATSMAYYLTKNSRANVTTRLWNQILTHHCLGLQSNALKDTLRVARLMQKVKVPFDAYTYAAIIRAYTVARRTDLARRILLRVVRKRNIPVLALHYAIIIDGYANQLRYEMGMRVHAHMLARRIRPTVSTRLALQKLQALSAERKMLIDRSIHPGVRLDIVDESLEEALATHDPSAIADKTPQLQSKRLDIADRYPAAYFDTPILFYNRVRAYDTVKTLIRKLGASGGTVPLRFMAVVMNLRYREGNHEEVDRYWGLAKATAFKLAKLSGHSQGKTYMPLARRTILARHLDIMLRSLAARKDQDAQTLMLETVNSLFSLGFDLDNTNWNIYIQLIATHGDHITAFILSERHLMSNFPTWDPNESRGTYYIATKQKSIGTEYLGARLQYLQPGVLSATYKTMTRFALIVRKLRRQAAFNPDSARQVTRLEKEAPRTMQAVLEMPMMEHPTATHVLGKRVRRGAKRSLV